MDNNVLEFEKMYQHNKVRVDYKFRKSGDIWVGEYQVRDKKLRGISQCITNDIAEAWDINCGAPFKGEKPESVEGLKELDLSCYRLPGVDLP